MSDPDNPDFGLFYNQKDSPIADPQFAQAGKSMLERLAGLLRMKEETVFNDVLNSLANRRAQAGKIFLDHRWMVK